MSQCPENSDLSEQPKGVLQGAPSVCTDHSAEFPAGEPQEKVLLLMDDGINPKGLRSPGDQTAGRGT